MESHELSGQLGDSTSGCEVHRARIVHTIESRKEPDTQNVSSRQRDNPDALAI